MLSLGEGIPLEEAAARAGLSVEDARFRVKSLKHLMASNDSNIDDFINLVENIETSINLHSSATTAEPDKPPVNVHSILDALVDDLDPQGLRDIACTLLRIADAVDQNWRPNNVRSAFKWPSAAARIERNSLELARRAKVILRFRLERTKTIAPSLLGEPAWEMLLELFCQFSGGAAISSKSLSIASGAAPTTALRQIDKLEAEGLIKRSPSLVDGRVTLIELTKDGVLAVGRILEQCP